MWIRLRAGRYLRYGGGFRTAESEPFEVTKEEGEALLSQGVAEEATGTEPVASPANRPDMIRRRPIPEEAKETA